MGARRDVLRDGGCGADELPIDEDLRARNIAVDAQEPRRRRGLDDRRRRLGYRRRSPRLWRCTASGRFRLCCRSSRRRRRRGCGDWGGRGGRRFGLRSVHHQDDRHGGSGETGGDQGNDGNGTIHAKILAQQRRDGRAVCHRVF
jgi:hypothetical protein